MAPETQVRFRSSFYAAKLDASDSGRDRICAAVVELVAARGYENMALKMVLEHAEVTCEEFEREFDGLEEAAIAAYDELSEHYGTAVEEAFHRAPGHWQDKLRAAAYTAARILRDSPVDCRFALYELMKVSEVARVHRDVLLEPFVDMVDLGRHLIEPRRHLTRATAEAAVGSILAAVLAQIATAGQAEDPSAYVPQLMYVAVRPYLGLRVAEEELKIPFRPGRVHPC